MCFGEPTCYFTLEFSITQLGLYYLHVMPYVYVIVRVHISVFFHYIKKPMGASASGARGVLIVKT